MNRRSFLKFVTTLCAASAIPPALVEACQSDLPAPADWIVRLLDSDGGIVSEMVVGNLGDQITFPTMTRTVMLTHFSVSGSGLPQKLISPLLHSVCACSGDTIHLCDVRFLM